MKRYAKNPNLSEEGDVFYNFQTPSLDRSGGLNGLPSSVGKRKEDRDG